MHLLILLILSAFLVYSIIGVLVGLAMMAAGVLLLAFFGILYGLVSLTPDGDRTVAPPPPPDSPAGPGLGEFFSELNSKTSSSIVTKVKFPTVKL